MDASYYRANIGSTDSFFSGAMAGGVAGMVLSFLAFAWFIMLALVVLDLIGLWKVFAKAGFDGWEALIPGHNFFVEFQLAGIKTYWIFLLFVPFVNIGILIWRDIELAKAFGKSTLFGLGVFFLAPIFIPILGFGKAKYVGTLSGSIHSSNSNV